MKKKDPQREQPHGTRTKMERGGVSTFLETEAKVGSFQKTAYYPGGKKRV